MNQRQKDIIFQNLLRASDSYLNAKISKYDLIPRETTKREDFIFDSCLSIWQNRCQEREVVD